MTYLSAISIMILLFLGWMMVCNTITLHQRHKLIDSRGKNGNSWEEDAALFQDVTYEQHMIYLMTFRNPLKLYK